MSTVHVITGATSGLGLDVARRLAKITDDRIIAGARSPATARALKDVVPAGRLDVLDLDTASPKRVSAFATAVKERLGGRGISSLSCIAGLQILGTQRHTADGIDETFATNVMGHLQLVDALSDSLARNAVVVTTGSGTHDPNNRLASRAGFAGADYASASAAASGENTRPDRDEAQRALDRYATSKLCAIYHAAAASTEPAFNDARIYCFDPGLMPGTALARERNAFVRFVWKRLMPVLSGFIDGVSSPERSACFLVDELILGQSGHASGDYIEFTGKPAPASRQARDKEAARRFLAETRALVPG